MKHTKKKGVTHITHRKTVEVYNTNDLAIRRRQLCETVVEMGNDSNSCASRSQFSQQLQPQKQQERQYQLQVTKAGASNGTIANKLHFPQLLKNLHEMEYAARREYCSFEQEIKRYCQPSLEEFNREIAIHVNSPCSATFTTGKALLNEQNKDRTDCMEQLWKEAAEMTRKWKIVTEKNKK